MKSFIGNVEAKLDVKGRVFMPSSYRKLLPEGEQERVVMRMDPDNACLVLYPEGVWERKVAQLREALDEWDADDQMLLMQFVSDAEFLDIDSQGRILISKPYLAKIEAQGALLFVGMLDRIAVWNKDNYEAGKLSRQDFAKRLSKKMSRKANEVE